MEVEDTKWKSAQQIQQMEICTTKTPKPQMSMRERDPQREGERERTRERERKTKKGGGADPQPKLGRRDGIAATAECNSHKLHSCPLLSFQGNLRSLFPYIHIHTYIHTYIYEQMCKSIAQKKRKEIII
jgi:hypothetical protein